MKGGRPSQTKNGTSIEEAVRSVAFELAAYFRQAAEAPGERTYGPEARANVIAVMKLLDEAYVPKSERGRSGA